VYFEACTVVQITSFNSDIEELSHVLINNRNIWMRLTKSSSQRQLFTRSAPQLINDQCISRRNCTSTKK